MKSALKYEEALELLFIHNSYDCSSELFIHNSYDWTSSELLAPEAILIARLFDVSDEKLSADMRVKRMKLAKEQAERFLSQADHNLRIAIEIARRLDR